METANYVLVRWRYDREAEMESFKAILFFDDIYYEFLGTEDVQYGDILYDADTARVTEGPKSGLHFYIVDKDRSLHTFPYGNPGSEKEVSYGMLARDWYDMTDDSCLSLIGEFFTIEFTVRLLCKVFKRFASSPSAKDMAIVDFIENEYDHTKMSDSEFFSRINTINGRTESSTMAIATTFIYQRGNRWVSRFVDYLRNDFHGFLPHTNNIVADYIRQLVTPHLLGMRMFEKRKEDMLRFAESCLKKR